MVALLGGADEVIVRAVHALGQGLEPRHRALGELLRRDVLLRGRLQHLDAVLVGTGEEVHVVAIVPLETRNRVGRDQLVGKSDMRRAIGIGDGRGQVVARLVERRAGFFGGLKLLSLFGLLGFASCLGGLKLLSLFGLLGLASCLGGFKLLALFRFLGLASCFGGLKLLSLFRFLGLANCLGGLGLLSLFRFLGLASCLGGLKLLALFRFLGLANCFGGLKLLSLFGLLGLA